MKPDKFGIKVWMLADADNYYVPRFQVYLEKKIARTVNCFSAKVWGIMAFGHSENPI